MLITCWLILPLFVLFPLSLYFAAKFYQYMMARFPAKPIGMRLLALTPMLVAIVSVPLVIAFLNAGYQASAAVGGQAQCAIVPR